MSDTAKTADNAIVGSFFTLIEMKSNSGYREFHSSGIRRIVYADGTEKYLMGEREVLHGKEIFDFLNKLSDTL